MTTTSESSFPLGLANYWRLGSWWWCTVQYAVVSRVTVWMKILLLWESYSRQCNCDARKHLYQWKVITCGTGWKKHIFFLIKPTRFTKFTNLFWHETCRVSCQNKFVNLVHLVGFITKKFVTMHGHMNVKYTFSYEIVAEKHSKRYCRQLSKQHSLLGIYLLTSERA
jgi:hypothetical protein